MTPDHSDSTSHYRSVAARAGARFVRLDPSARADPSFQTVNPLAARLLGDQVFRQLRILPVAYDDGVVTIAGPDPHDRTARAVAASVAPGGVRFVVAPPQDIDRAAAEVRRVGDEMPARASATPVASSGPGPVASGARLIGAMLLGHGLISEAELADALAEQERSGGRLGEVLVGSGAVDEERLIAVLAEQFELPLVDLAAYQPEDEALGVIPEPVARELRLMALAVDERTLYLAATEPIDDGVRARIADYTALEPCAFLASHTAIDELARRLYRERHLAEVTTGALERWPGQPADQRLTARRLLAAGGVALAIGACAVLVPALTVIVVAAATGGLALVACAYAALLCRSGRDRPPHGPGASAVASDDYALAPYTVIVAVAPGTPGPVLAELARSLDEIAYPRVRLDVRVVCAQEDRGTIAALARPNGAPGWRLLTLPDGEPWGEAKARNYGLLQAEGELVAVLGPHDRLDPDQLRRAAAAFAGAPEVGCVVARVSRRSPSWLWFEVLVPGLAASDAVVPLAGTCNHFRRDALRDVGGWNPFTTAADTDLAVRLRRRGHRVRPIDSTTRRPVRNGGDSLPGRLGVALGFLEAWLTHMHRPRRLLGQLGPRCFLAFQVMAGAVVWLLLASLTQLLLALSVLDEIGLLGLELPRALLYLLAGQVALAGVSGLGCEVVAALRHRRSRGAQAAPVAPTARSAEVLEAAVDEAAAAPAAPTPDQLATLADIARHLDELAIALRGLVAEMEGHEPSPVSLPPREPG